MPQPLLGGEFQVNTYTTGLQIRASVSVSDDGGFVVAWDSEGSSGTDTLSRSVQGRRFGGMTVLADDFESGDTTAWSNTQ